MDTPLHEVCRRFIFHDFITTNAKTNKHRVKKSLQLDPLPYHLPALKHTQREATTGYSKFFSHSNSFLLLSSASRITHEPLKTQHGVKPLRSSPRARRHRRTCYASPSFPAPRMLKTLLALSVTLSKN